MSELPKKISQRRWSSLGSIPQQSQMLVLFYSYFELQEVFILRILFLFIFYNKLSWFVSELPVVVLLGSQFSYFVFIFR